MDDLTWIVNLIVLNHSKANCDNDDNKRCPSASAREYWNTGGGGGGYSSTIITRSGRQLFQLFQLFQREQLSKVADQSVSNIDGKLVFVLEGIFNVLSLVDILKIYMFKDTTYLCKDQK